MEIVASLNRIGARMRNNTTEEIPLLGGILLTRKECFVKALDLMPKNTDALYNLASVLGPTETAELKDGTKLTHKDCLSKYLQFTPKNQLTAQDAAVMVNLGVALTKKDDKKRCYVHALHLNPQMVEAYGNLGYTLEPGEKVTLKDGRVMDRQECFLKAVEIDPARSRSFFNLGSSIGELGSSSDGNDERAKSIHETTKKLSILLNNDNLESSVSCPMSVPLSPRRASQLADSLKGMSSQLLLNDPQIACYLEAIKLQPRDTESLINLGVILPAGCKVPLPPNNVPTNNIGCFLKALEYKPKDPDAYYNLANALPSGGTVVLPHGCFHPPLPQNTPPEVCTVGHKELYRLAIQWNPKFAEAFFNLGNYLENGETVTISYPPTVQLAYNRMVKEESFNKKSCYARALELQPEDLDCLINLGALLKDETITITGKNDDGEDLPPTTWSRLRCFIRVAEIRGDTDIDAWINLAFALGTRHHDSSHVKPSVAYVKGKEYTRLDCLLRAIVIIDKICESDVEYELEKTPQRVLDALEYEFEKLHITSCELPPPGKGVVTLEALRQRIAAALKVSL